MKITPMDIREICERVIKRILSNKHLFENYDESTIDKIVAEEIGEQEYYVTHIKDSIKKYGNGNEYEGFDSWIEFWEKRNSEHKKVKTIGKCPCCGEPMLEPDGAHVKDDSDNIYITPTCSKCNGASAQDEKFRALPFKVKFKYLVPFNYNELKKLRHAK